jgi:hypothetical protein
MNYFLGKMPPPTSVGICRAGGSLNLLQPLKDEIFSAFILNPSAFKA